MRSTPIITKLMLVAAPVGVLGLAALMLWLSGNWRWVEGWIFGVWWVSFMAAFVLWLHYKDPALLAERMRLPGSAGESRTDMAILIGLKSASWLRSFCRRWICASVGHPRLPLWSEVCGGILLLGGSFFMLRAFTDNTLCLTVGAYSEPSAASMSLTRASTALFATPCILGQV